MVGTASAELESANEVILFDHMYYKMPEEVVVTTTDDSSSVKCHLEDQQTPQSSWESAVTDNSTVTTSQSTSTGTEEVDNSILDDFGNDIASLANLDLLDFEQLVDFPGLNANSLSQPEAGSQSPFMQVTDDVYSPVMSPTLSTTSPTRTEKHSDIIDNTLLDIPDMDFEQSIWHESFTLFPTLNI